MPRYGSGQQLSAKHQYAHLRGTQDTYREFGRKPVAMEILRIPSGTGTPVRHVAKPTQGLGRHLHRPFRLPPANSNQRLDFAPMAS